MVLQFSEDVRTEIMTGVETVTGGNATVELRTGAAPASAAAADSGTLLVEMALDSDWATVSGGVLSFSDVPLVATATASGVMGHFRLKASDGTVHAQGTVTVNALGGDMTFDTTTVTDGQVIAVTSWTLTAPGA